MPAARKLGVDYEGLRPLNPDLIYCHVSSYGQEGPRADWPGFDQMFQASCGWEAENGGEGNPPMWLRFGVTDHMAALASLYALLLALYRRGRGGGGQIVSASLLGAAVLTEAEAVARPDGSITKIARLDADQTGLSPEHRIYHCADGWVAVAALEPGEAKALHVLTGSTPSAFFEGRMAADALDSLTDAGVPSAPVRENQIDPFLDDPDNAAAGIIAHYRHAEFGDMDQVGGLWNLGDLVLKLDRAAPALGQHTREVLCAVGLSASDVDGLVGAGLAAAPAAQIRPS
jgi:crotonobetainyl-CoA:carnitine CoA-transferase CaiB-like acyl-CoA transferase